MTQQERVEAAINAVLIEEHDRVTGLVLRQEMPPQSEITAAADLMVSRLAKAAIEAMEEPKK